MKASAARKRQQEEPAFPLPPFSAQCLPIQCGFHKGKISGAPQPEAQAGPPLPADKGASYLAESPWGRLHTESKTCLSPKKRKSHWRSRQLTASKTAAAGKADDFLRWAPLKARCSSSTKGRSRRCSAAAAASLVQNIGICCSSGCETETLQSTCASGRDEPIAGSASPRAYARKRQPETARRREQQEAATSEAVIMPPYDASCTLLHPTPCMTQSDAPQREEEQKEEACCRLWSPVQRQRQRGLAAAASLETLAAATPHGSDPATSYTGDAHEKLSGAPFSDTAPECRANMDGFAAADASRSAYLREELLHRAEGRYTAVFVPVDRHLAEQVNGDFVVSDISRYPVKSTPCGELRELILRRPQQTEDSKATDAPLLSDEVSEDSDDSDLDERVEAMGTAATEPRSPTTRQQELGQLLKHLAQIAKTATDQQSGKAMVAAAL
ncbi:putative cyclin-dependent kinase [Cyclospora cayetanensis]|uniref:Cyclin-dependent kinase n=1 Tax=Cyclospora cayetanensis TaxID=88456 RepID=A0A1D3D5F1_9EIME|nr:putative cyclin-dependent kinase [Cyclospora cayetanensis]